MTRSAVTAVFALLALVPLVAANGRVDQSLLSSESQANGRIVPRRINTLDTDDGECSGYDSTGYPYNPSFFSAEAYKVECDETLDTGGEGTDFVCSNGLFGIESSDGSVCCVSECGQCGGEGCSTVAAPEYGASDCCANEIAFFGVSCNSTLAAPCVIVKLGTPATTPTSSPVDSLGSTLTSAPSSAPTAVDGASTCSDGTPGLESSEGQVCCPAGCGECGGPFCSTAALPSFGESDCCVITIMNSGVMCETTGESPCILEVGGPVSQTPSPTGVATLPPLLVESTDDSISMCSNGIPGVESSNGLACCVAACGVCGGEGCSTVGLPDLDEEDCCVSEIVDFGMPCDTAGAAPCAIFGDTGQSCNNGVAGVMSADASVCCASDCEVCGEEACSTFSYLGAGANDCCSTDIFVFGELCESTGEAPCVITADLSFCSNGIAGVESSNGEACCVSACGQCGGVGCSTAGLPTYDEEDCCVSEIVDFGVSCATTGSAPCFIDEVSVELPSPAPAAVMTSMSPTTDEVTVVPPSGGDVTFCSNGIPGVESSNGLACCVEACGQCGGVGCSTVGLPTHDAFDCCSTEIVDFGDSCELVDSAPCIIDQGASESSDAPAPTTIVVSSMAPTTDAATAAPITTTVGEMSFCSNGIPGVESSNGLACCVEACGQCGGVGCSTVGLPTYDQFDCCTTEIVEFGTSCELADSAPCIIDQVASESSDAPTPAPIAVSSMAPTTDAATAAPITTTVGETSFCSNGIPGVESSNGLACCVEACGQCGGVGCSTVGLPTYDQFDCCTTEIVEFGEWCELADSAPCIIDQVASESSDAPTPAPIAVSSMAPTTDAATAAPITTTVGETSFCSNGIPGVESSNGLACCVEACGQCGGVGCSTVGLPTYDQFDCCTTEIVEFGESCELADSAPCIIDQVASESSDAPTPAPIAVSSMAPTTDAATAAPITTTVGETSFCSNGIPGVESSNGLACCVEACGQCGGVGCSTVGLPTYDQFDCCTTEIVEFGESCELADSAPCIIDQVASESSDAPTPAPIAVSSMAPTTDAATAAPITTTVGETSFCSNGIPGVESSNGLACCVEACGQCGDVGCSTVGLPTYDQFDCCTTEIVEFGTSCELADSAPCIIDQVTTGSTSETTPAPIQTSAFPTPTVGLTSTPTQISVPAPTEMPVTFPPVPETSGCVASFTFVGCFAEETEDPFNTKRVDNGLTPQTCFETCLDEGAFYMGLIDGNECMCGVEPLYVSEDKTEGSCTSTCAGDASQVCGGSLSFNLYAFSQDCG